MFPGCFGPCYETPFSFSGHKTSYIIGAFLGYRVQMGMWVVGVEGDINWQKGETSHAQNTPPPWLGYELFTGSQKQGADGSIRGRLGYLVTPWTLLYATGGLAIGQVSGSFSYAGCQFCDVFLVWDERHRSGVLERHTGRRNGRRRGGNPGVDGREGPA